MAMFLDWLEGVIHTILFIREIYPPELFERTQLFNVPVQRCRAPELNEYIHDVVESLRDFIEREELERVAVQINEKNGTPLERFVIDVTFAVLKNTTDLTHLERTLRFFLIRLNFCASQLTSIPKECTFNVLIYTSNEITDPAWIEPERVNFLTQNVTLIPLRSARTGPLKLQLYVEKANET